MKRIALMLLFLVAATTVAAQEKLSPLLQEETVLVVHVDFTKIDAKKIVLDNTELLTKICKNLGFYDSENLETLFFNEPDRENFRQMTTDWKRLAMILDNGNKTLTGLFGVGEAFFVLNARGPAPCYVAIPKTDKLKPEMIRQALQTGPPVLVHEIPGFLLLVFDWNGTARKSEETVKSFLEQVASKKPDADPRFTEAFQSIEQFPVKLALSFPKYFEKVFRDTRPMLPGTLERIDLARTAGNFRWLALGVDPVGFEIVCHTEAASEPAAAELRQTGEILAELCFEKWLEMIREYENEPESSTLFDFLSFFGKSLIEISSRENFDILKKEILPQPQGKRLTVHIDRNRVSQVAELAIPFGMQITEIQRSAARRMQCVNNLKMLGVALHNYHDAKRNFPSAYTVDENGKPLHSWRVLVLPYVDQEAMYKAIRLNEPWDSEHNRQFHDKMPSVFRCPQLKKGNPRRDTGYCMVVGDDTFGRPGEKGLKIAELTDGTSNTFMILERKEPICWMAPTDITQEDAYLGVNKKAEGIGSNHEAGFNAVLCDGSVHFISETIALDVLKAILTVSGGESAGL